MNHATRILFYGITLMVLGIFMSIDAPQGPGWGDLGLLVAVIGVLVGLIGIVTKDS